MKELQKVLEETAKVHIHHIGELEVFSKIQFNDNSINYKLELELKPNSKTIDLVYLSFFSTLYHFEYEFRDNIKRFSKRYNTLFDEYYKEKLKSHPVIKKEFFDKIPDNAQEVKLKKISNICEVYLTYKTDDSLYLLIIETDEWEAIKTLQESIFANPDILEKLQNNEMKLYYYTICSYPLEECFICEKTKEKRKKFLDNIKMERKKKELLQKLNVFELGMYYPGREE